MGLRMTGRQLDDLAVALARAQRSTQLGNRTGLRSLNRLGKDPRVHQIYGDSDGLWCELANGYQNGADPGTHCIHENTARDILRQASRIRTCDCSECAAPLATIKPRRRAAKR